MSKFGVSQNDLHLLAASKPVGDDLLDPYYFSHVQGDIEEILSIRRSVYAL